MTIPIPETGGWREFSGLGVSPAGWALDPAKLWVAMDEALALAIDAKSQGARMAALEAEVVDLREKVAFLRVARLPQPAPDRVDKRPLLEQFATMMMPDQMPLPLAAPDHSAVTMRLGLLTDSLVVNGPGWSHVLPKGMPPCLPGQGVSDVVICRLSADLVLARMEIAHLSSEVADLSALLPAEDPGWLRVPPEGTAPLPRKEETVRLLDDLSRLVPNPTYILSPPVGGSDPVLPTCGTAGAAQVQRRDALPVRALGGGRASIGLRGLAGDVW